MSNTVPQQIALLDRQIADLAAQRAYLKQHRATLDAARWPKRVNLYVHGSKESTYDKGRELGLTGEAADQFMFITYEIVLVYDVYEDGTATLLACNGQMVQAVPITLPAEGAPNADHPA